MAQTVPATFGGDRIRGANMAGDALNDFDKQLSDYAAGNVRTHLGDPDFAGFLKGELPPALYSYFRRGRNHEVEQDVLLLGEGELDAIIDALSCCPQELVREWEPHEPLHRRHVHTLSEVRELLSKQ